MHAPIALGVTAFVLCLIATPVCREIFLRFNIVDRPDDTRKLHHRPIPHVGGIAIVLSYGLALWLLLLFAPQGSRMLLEHRQLLASLLLPAGVIFVTGLIDDLVTLRPLHKLAGQTVGVLLAVALGARFHVAGGNAVADWIAIPLSIVWLLACTNALNLIDGLDGLAAGVGLFATVTTSVAAILLHDTGLLMATAPLAGCLLAFLLFNFNPASVFLGDGGSLTIGFLLGSFTLIWSQESATLLGMAAPVMVLAVPLVDVGLSIGRRYLRNRPIFQADRGHIHHRLLALGFTPPEVALILYGVCGIAAILSLLESVLSGRYQGVLVILFCAITLLGIQRLGYVELSAARKLCSRRLLLRSLRERIYLDSLVGSLQGATTHDACWEIVYASCEELQFASVELELDGQSYAGLLAISDEDPSWVMTITLGDRGHMRLTRLHESASPSLMMLALHTFQQSLIAKENLNLAPCAAQGGSYFEEERRSTVGDTA